MGDDLDPTGGTWPPLDQLTGLLRAAAVSSVELTAAALARIEAVDPALRAVLALDPTALAQARDADARLRAGSRRPLDGVPVLVKDNVDTAGLSTTAGSRLLLGCPPVADAAVVAGLRAAGAVLLGKTNLSEWGNFRSTDAVEGWSAVGGQTRNPYHPEHSPWGSSSGSAVAVAAGMAPVALGTETDGSVVCPAAVCGVVGLKPALGVLPVAGIVPISTAQDTAGVLTTRVGDAAHVLAALTGDRSGPPRLPGEVRLGVWTGRRFDAAAHAAVHAVAERLRATAVHTVHTVPVELPFDRDRFDDGLHALIAGFAPCLAAYLRGRPGAPADLSAVLAGNRADPVELSLFGQNLMELVAATDAEQRRSAPRRRARARAWARAALGRVLTEHRLTAVLAPTAPPAWRIDHAAGDPAAPSTSTIPALAGRPVVTVPTGWAGPLPTGVSVFGPADTGTVLAVAALVEAVAGDRRPPTLWHDDPATLPRDHVTG